MSATMTDTAASQTGQTGTGQAAGSQQGDQQTGQTTTQSGQGQTTGQGQQGSGSGSATQPGDGTTAATTTAAAATPPARYELRLPEQTMLDQSDVDAVATLAKTKQWTNEQAQAALTEMHTSLSEQATRFRAELDADPEVGGAHLEQAQMYAMRFLDRFLPPDSEEGKWFRQVMNKSGYGNNAKIVKLFSRAGKAMSEDQPGTTTGRFAAPTKRRPEDVLFGDAQGIRPPG